MRITYYLIYLFSNVSEFVTKPKITSRFKPSSAQASFFGMIKKINYICLEIENFNNEENQLPKFQNREDFENQFMIHENDKEHEEDIQNAGIIKNVRDNIEHENSKKKPHSMKTTARGFNQNNPKFDAKKSKKINKRNNDENSTTLKDVSPKVKKMNDAATNIS